MFLPFPGDRARARDDPVRIVNRLFAGWSEPTGTIEAGLPGLPSLSSLWPGQVLVGSWRGVKVDVELVPLEGPFVASKRA